LYQFSLEFGRSRPIFSGDIILHDLSFLFEIRGELTTRFYYNGIYILDIERRKQEPETSRELYRQFVPQANLGKER